MANKSWSEIIKENKTLFLVIIIIFFLIEVEIFAVALMRSGRQSWMNVLDNEGQVIYEVKGAVLTNFNKYYFENTFGPLEKYQVQIVTKESKFPFRAWLSATVGVPVGLVLLLAFVLKAAMAILYGKSSSDGGDEMYSDGDTTSEKSSRKGARLKSGAENLLFQVSRLNIFIIGFLILSSVLLYWIVPNLLSFLAKAGMETILDFKWFFIAAVSALFLLFAWFMYMKYQLARKSMDAQTEIKKYELQLEYAKNRDALPALEHHTDEEMPQVGYSASDKGNVD